MTRVFSSSWRLIVALTVLLLGLVSSPAFAGKPTVAVLGLEVVDPTGQIDQATTAVAKDLTDALRSRAKMPSGPYAFQPGSEKELIDEKLIKNCDNEAVSCMSQIGKDIGADYLIYGRLEKKPDGYVVLINLLNVTKKKFEKAKSPLTIPHAAAKDPTSIGGAAAKAYNDLVGVISNGTLIVRSNADHGTVLIDNEPKGSLSSGTLTLSLAEGPYRLSVEADGFERSTETKVTVRSNDTTTQSVTLVEAKGKKPDEILHTTTGTTSTTKSNIWKPMFVVSTIIAVGAGGLWGFSYYKEHADGKNVKGELATVGVQHGELSSSNCSGARSAEYRMSKSFVSACTWNDRKTYGIIGTSVGVALMAITGYLAFGRGDSAESPKSTGTVGRKVRKPSIAVTPVVSADGGGAAFRIDW